MKTKMMICAALIAFGAAVLVTPAVAADKKVKSNKKDLASAATVNGVVITKDAVDKEFSQFRHRIQQQGQEIGQDQIADLKHRILENLIARELLFQDSKKQGIKIPAASVTEKIDQLKKQFPSPAEFQAAMAKMKLTEADVKQQFARGMAVEKLVETKIAPKVIISDKDSKDFYDAHPEFFHKPEEIKASHILIKVGENADAATKAAARKKIEAAKARIDKGEDFAKVASDVSEGPTKTKGGDLGYFHKGQMVPAFETAAFALKPGQVSDIVESPFGFHLIKVFDKKPESTLAYDTVKDKISEHLKQEKVREAVGQYVDQLKKAAKIKMTDSVAAKTKKP
jgi:peptidyl-prolyl cis-trans isomerase C